MLIIVLANESLKTELLTQGTKENVHLEWINEPGAFLDFPDADAYIDLLFKNEVKRIIILQQLLPKPIFVNAVIPVLTELPVGFIRFNGWNTFLNRPIVEAASMSDMSKIKATEVFSLFNKKIEWVPDIPGLISARVIAMIINEAYFALNENVSTKEEINIAMKLGTNYPYGPFEWAEKIGLKNIFELLNNMAKTTKRYEPSALLTKEAFS